MVRVHAFAVSTYCRKIENHVILQLEREHQTVSPWMTSPSRMTVILTSHQKRNNLDWRLVIAYSVVSVDKTACHRHRPGKHIALRPIDLLTLTP